MLQVNFHVAKGSGPRRGARHMNYNRFCFKSTSYYKTEYTLNVIIPPRLSFFSSCLPCFLILSARPMGKGHVSQRFKATICHLRQRPLEQPSFSSFPPSSAPSSPLWKVLLF